MSRLVLLPAVVRSGTLLRERERERRTERERERDGERERERDDTIILRLKSRYWRICYKLLRT